LCTLDLYLHAKKVPEHKYLSILCFAFFLGSVFHESDILIHQSIRHVADGINKDQEILNGSRMDLNVQFAQVKH